MITERKITIPIYEVPVKIVIFDKEKEVRDKYPEFFSEGTKACTVENFETGDLILILPSYRMSDIAHEGLHLMNCIYRQKGIQPQRDNDEHEAYLIGYIFMRIEKILYEHLA